MGKQIDKDIRDLAVEKLALAMKITYAEANKYLEMMDQEANKEI